MAQEQKPTPRNQTKEKKIDTSTTYDNFFRFIMYTRGPKDNVLFSFYIINGIKFE